MNFFIPLAAFLTVILTQAFYFFKVKALEKKLDFLLEQKVEEVLLNLRDEIPMGSTFLRGGLLERLKMRAIHSVKKIIPAIKEKGGSSLSFLLIPWGLALLAALATLWMQSLMP